MLIDWTTQSECPDGPSVRVDTLNHAKSQNPCVLDFTAYHRRVGGDSHWACGMRLPAAVPTARSRRARGNSFSFRGRRTSVPCLCGLREEEEEWGAVWA